MKNIIYVILLFLIVRPGNCAAALVYTFLQNNNFFSESELWGPRDLNKPLPFESLALVRIINLNTLNKYNRTVYLFTCKHKKQLCHRMSCAITILNHAPAILNSNLVIKPTSLKLARIIQNRCATVSIPIMLLTHIKPTIKKTQNSRLKLSEINQSFIDGTHYGLRTLTAKNILPFYRRRIKNQLDYLSKPL